MTIEITDNKGSKYQVELQAFWDDKKTIRFSGALDPGNKSWRFWASDIVYSSIKTPDGNFIGE